MSELKKLIDRIVEFGTNEKLVSKNKILEIQKLLVGIYAEYLNVEPEFDDKDYEEPLRLDYDGIRGIVTQHFPDFGWYHSVWESHKINEDAVLITGDAIDDLTDIIKDLIEVQWRFENNSEKDGLYQFEFLMRHHCEQHLVDLLKYLKEITD
ncbi:hypothetical protein DFQ11_1124 [Winogradskyella epiphytica]|uniref:DUF5063 domain-containing protein n=1 Tax=Winogradskyella epiphytica TaxID=262005 RepID=A0A2V4WT62_9FLAO|nr:DUF5063 domain-containing protein [Winogradskyella epiphytica]PYE79258.1 hypothetical protein DFQ11_1124 [Winogradskyella epiphytica]GGW74531.1 hypothetical protein GCM10008085_28310 [Winogradskyella epiphytica]